MSNQSIFVSYSHKDRQWLERVQTMLKPLERNAVIDLWSDDRIKTGDQWRGQITDAIDKASIAILLVSPGFLASDFIANQELPPLLQAAQQRGLWIVWVSIDYCLYDETDIAKYQAANDPSRPLSSLEEHEISKALTKMAQDIRNRLRETKPDTANLEVPESKADRPSPQPSTVATPPRFPWPDLARRANPILNEVRVQLEQLYGDTSSPTIRQWIEPIISGTEEKSLQVSVLDASRNFIFHADPNQVGRRALHAALDGADIYDNIYAAKAGFVAWMDYACYGPWGLLYMPEPPRGTTSVRIRQSLALFTSIASGLKVVVELHDEVGIESEAAPPEKWVWERKEQAYSTLIDALSTVAQYGEALLLDRQTGQTVQRKRLAESESQARDIIDRFFMAGAYIISEKAVAHLQTFRQEAFTAGDNPDWDEAIELNVQAAEKCLAALRDCAKRELGFT